MNPRHEGDPSSYRSEYENAKNEQQRYNTMGVEALFAGRKLTNEERDRIRLTNEDFRFVESELRARLNRLRSKAEERLEGVLGKHQEEAQELNERYEHILENTIAAFMELHEFEQSPAGTSNEPDDVDERNRLTRATVEALQQTMDFEQAELGMKTHDSWASFWKKFQDEIKAADKESA